MNNTPGNNPRWDRKTLELTLRDGLDRLEEFALMLAFQGRGSQFEILSITPPPTHPEPRRSSPHGEKHNVVNLREAKLQKTA